MGAFDASAEPPVPAACILDKIILSILVMADLLCFALAFSPSALEMIFSCIFFTAPGVFRGIDLPQVEWYL